MNNITAYVPAYKYSTDEWGIRSSSPVLYMKETVEHELSSCYVKWEDYEALRQSYINLNASYSAVKELDKHE